MMVPHAKKGRSSTRPVDALANLGPHGSVEDGGEFIVGAKDRK